MANPKFEIGVVYKKNSRLYLAVTERELISFKHGKLVEVRPYVRYNALRNVTVNDLCKRWKVSSERLDQATRAYLTPDTEDLKTRPRGTRMQRQYEDIAWRIHRTIRLAG